MRKNYIFKEFKIPLYKTIWQLFVTPDINSISHKRHRQFLLDCGISDKWNGCYFVAEDEDTGGNSLCIWLKDLDSLGTIAHEAMHFAIDLLERKGLKFSKDSEEAYTYLTDYIVEQIISARPKDNI